MIKELLYKLFNVEPFPCATCEVLQIQLEDAQRQNRFLLDKLLTKDTPPVETPTPVEELQPLGNRFVPFRVRQAALEAEDRAKAEVMRKNREEVEQAKKRVVNAPSIAQQQASIDSLEKELGLKEG
jgi:hypothetical protein